MSLAILLPFLKSKCLGETSLATTSLAFGNEGDRQPDRQTLAAEKLQKKQYKQRLRITKKDKHSTILQV